MVLFRIVAGSLASPGEAGKPAVRPTIGCTPAPVSPLSAALLAAAISAAALFVLLRFRARLPIDAPNRRSLHQRPVPRIGGIAIWLGVLVAGALAHVQWPGGALVLLGFAATLAVSLVDDGRGVHPAARLAVHLAAAALAAFGLVHDAPGEGFTASAALVVLLAGAIAWSANAFNFMDGSDGLAAGMAMIGFAAFALASPRPEDARLYVIVAAAVVPFAALNLPPARAFMGDAGAVPFGFLAAACGAGGWLQHDWPAWFAPLVFMPFLADATLTLLRRLARGDRVWEAHREHFYQRLHRQGRGHAGTLYIYGALMLAAAVLAVATLRIEPDAGWGVLAAYGAALGAFFLRVDYHWRRHPEFNR